MVRINVGGNKVDVNELPVGTYYIEKTIYDRGDKAGTVDTVTYQVKRRKKDGVTTHYWGKASKTDVNGVPLPIPVAHIIEGNAALSPDTVAKRAKEGVKYRLSAAFDQNGEHPSSVYILKRRKDGDGYRNYWSVESTTKKGTSRAKPKSKAKAKTAAKTKAKPAPRARGQTARPVPRLPRGATMD